MSELALPAQRQGFTPYTSLPPMVMDPTGENPNPNANDSAFEPGPQPSVDPPVLYDDKVAPLEAQTADDGCLIGLPKMAVRFAPDFPGFCLLKRSHADAILGWLVMSAGVFVMAAGVLILVKTDNTVLQAAGMTANPVKAVARKRPRRKAESASDEGENSGDTNDDD